MSSTTAIAGFHFVELTKIGGWHRLVLCHLQPSFIFLIKNANVYRHFLLLVLVFTTALSPQTVLHITTAVRRNAIVTPVFSSGNMSSVEVMSENIHVKDLHIHTWGTLSAIHHSSYDGHDCPMIYTSSDVTGIRNKLKA